MAIALSAMYMSIAACNGTAADSKDKDSTGSQAAQTEQLAGSEQDSVPYKIAENYFVNNSVKDSIPAKITDKATFDQYFGMAATMGAGGEPTPIDFNEQYVIVLNHPTTAQKIELIPLGLIKKDGNIVLSYKQTVGEQLGFTIHPLLILVVNKKDDGNLVLQKQ
ncbi:hypothetical protein SAMN05192529_10136 [Arachidicoccus rhizosphaerae]|uniref:Uncharacterized protein n=2 Tax=Arachidicoccus rhizosphaerae TaxID=551991 RepID=A0A1H3VFC9_9BACT|nr:hypothetical protein SAMN05192529_10136 [Arachidicoccus rhizosphaerae]